MPALQCHFCGAPITLSEPIPRDLECDSCRRDVRCCINCRHYDTRYNNACRETMADPVEDKERRNFCEYFSFNPAPHEAARGPSAKAREARAGLDVLFGGKPDAPDPADASRKKLESMLGSRDPGARSEDARKKLEALFGKPRPDPDPGELLHSKGAASRF